MSTLRDEAYEKLDYLSQLTEVVINPQNEVLARIPDRMTLSFEQVCEVKAFRYPNDIGISVYSVLALCVGPTDREVIDNLGHCFELEVDEHFELDLLNKRMSGTIALVKTVQQLEEKEILEIAVKKAYNCFKSGNWPTKRLREKITTVLNILEANSGTEWAKKANKNIAYVGREAISESLSRVILENKWRIRNVVIIEKVGEWIDSYLSDQGEADTGLANLFKLKIMLDKDLPVYSVDEVKNAICT